MSNMTYQLRRWCCISLFSTKQYSLPKWDTAPGYFSHVCNFVLKPCGYFFSTFFRMHCNALRKMMKMKLECELSNLFTWKSVIRFYRSWSDDWQLVWMMKGIHSRSSRGRFEIMKRYICADRVNNERIKRHLESSSCRVNVYRTVECLTLTT